MQIWRSAGWPCRDGIEIDLLAARLVVLQPGADGCETLQLTEAGIAYLAEARQSGLRALSSHDRLAQRFAEQHLLAASRLLKYWFARMRPRTSTAQNGLQAIILSLARGGAPSKLSFF